LVRTRRPLGLVLLTWIEQRGSNTRDDGSGAPFCVSV
jgi:hypothetical protein